MSDHEVPRLLLAFDGNSLLHRAHHAMAGSALRDAQGRPTWGLRGLVSLVATAAARLTPDAVVIGFDCTQTSDRRSGYPGYKAGRPDKPPELRAQLDEAPGLLAAAGFGVVVPPGHEADDVLASSAALARRHGWRCTVVTSDRDAFALIDETTSVLRLIDGGVEGSPVLTPARLPSLCGVRAGQYRDYAALRGDASDNLVGAPGIGPKTAARLLAVFDRVQDAYDALDGGRGDEVVAAIGAAAATRLGRAEARANVARNLRLMTMREDLPMPELSALHLPLDPQRLRAGLAGRGISLGNAVWALTGGLPPLRDADWYAEQDGAALLASGVEDLAAARELLGGQVLGEQVLGARVGARPAPVPAAPVAGAAPVAAAEQLSLFG